MTSNHKLKQDCKATLNSIRGLLSLEERQKVEPHLRQILDLTKSLVENAKVSPEELEALSSQVGTLTADRTRLSDTNAVLQRDLKKASKLNGEFAALQSEKDCLDEVLIEMICCGLELDVASLANLIEVSGDTGITRWISKRASSIENDATQRRALLVICLTLMSVYFSDELISELLTAVCNAARKNKGSRTWVDAFSSSVEAVFTQNSDSEQLSGDEWWWLAVNGASCAACFFPARVDDLEVSPVPEQLIGFRTREEQLEIQQFFLTAPIQDVGRYMASVPRKVKAGELGYLRPDNPEPPSHDSTMWHVKRHKAV